MSAVPTINPNEKDLRVVCEFIRAIQNGRWNGHGTFTLNANATTTTVTTALCKSASHVSITPSSATAAADVGSATGVYVTPGNGSFVVTHPNTADTDKTFTYAIIGN